MRHGASGTTYISCGEANSTLIVDDASMGNVVETHLVDDGVTAYAFDRVMLYGGATLAFEPANVGDAVVTASIGQLLGDGTGTLKITNNRRVFGQSQTDNAPYHFDSSVWSGPYWGSTTSWLGFGRAEKCAILTSSGRVWSRAHFSRPLRSVNASW